MHTRDWMRLAAALVIPQAAGLIGSVFTTPNIRPWYDTLVKPELAPPNWVFAPVWTTLFVLMGIALYLVWKRGLGRRDVRIGVGLFSAQLLCNVLWSLVFFGMQDPGFALFVIAALWAGIVATIVAFYRVSKTAALLMVPYLAWVSFASYLNYSIWTLN